MTAALIRADHLFKIYRTGEDELYALNDLTLEIPEGQYTAIMGASGSGKSTLMNILGALDRPSRGEYRLDGELVSEMNDNHLSSLRNRKIGFVFQSFNLLPRLTAIENVEVPLTYAGVRPRDRRARAIEALTRVGLAERLTHRPTQLSGGQQQRVAIARALVTNPRLLLADEPTGALDTDTTGQILTMLDELHRGGLTILVVTHEPEVAAHAQRVVWVRDGKIVADGPPSQVVGNRLAAQPGQRAGTA
ncbi:MAG: ABC transporter ATP-binding protein [Myxococcota bacterium]